MNDLVGGSNHCVRTVVHGLLETPIITSICDPNQSYSEFAKSLIESIYEQSQLLELLKSIHPSKLTAYQLLFGASHALIVKPTWAQDYDVTDGCLDIIVAFHPRNQDEFLPLSTPGVSVLHTLPSMYADAQGTSSSESPVLELDMIFCRISKFNNPIFPYSRKDELTKLILIQEQHDSRLSVHSEVKDWDQEDDDCTLPTTWICEFDITEEEDALVAARQRQVNGTMTDLVGSSNPCVSAVVHCPLETPILTSICDPNQSYSEFAKSLIESIYEQSQLLELLKSIHPSKLTAYQLLFGASHALIVKPTWAQDDDVTDGCLDINVAFHPRNQDEFLPLSTPGVSVLRTLPSKYMDAQGTSSSESPVLELDMIFYRIRKFNNPILPYPRKDELTKLILLHEQPGGRSEVKDWDQEDDDCTLPMTGICDSTEEEDALVAGDRGRQR
eukprot:scaffold5008_cov55-Cyclotella_meneghiniana.AAC.3